MVSANREPVAETSYCFGFKISIFNLLLRCVTITLQIRLGRRVRPLEISRISASYTFVENKINDLCSSASELKHNTMYNLESNDKSITLKYFRLEPNPKFISSVMHDVYAVNISIVSTVIIFMLITNFQSSSCIN